MRGRASQLEACLSVASDFRSSVVICVTQPRLPAGEVENLCGTELYRVANDTRTDVTLLSNECEAAERRAVLRAAAGLDGGEPLTRGERVLVMLERIWLFEDEWRASSAQECHMEAEWGGGAPA